MALKAPTPLRTRGHANGGLLVLCGLATLGGLASLFLLRAVSNNPQPDVSSLLYIFYTAGLTTVAALIGTLLAATTILRSDNKKVAPIDNNVEQQAILRLINEVEGLSKGDLTVKASVTTEATGVIADSINMAVDTLRSLVTTVHKATLRVTEAVISTQDTSKLLAGVANEEAEQIQAATQRVNSVSVSAQHVAQQASDCTKVAQHSVDIATNSSEVVHRTIEGMNAIRGQIQDTSKRIKRLGESSQEIGTIVDIIDDIAEQTNILALNAAIQAAAAGEAGQGFAVVADEVQRLSERAAASTKRISALVQTIRSDAMEAINSMERSTSEVINGARSTESAGAALKEIEQVSKHLSELILTISRESANQTEAVEDVNSAMARIRDISGRTVDGAKQATSATSNLTQVAQELRKSVADFKLPSVS